MTTRVWSVAVSASMVLLLALYVVATGQIAAAERVGQNAVLNVSGQALAIHDAAIDMAEARRAVAKDPLNQRLLNVAMLKAMQGDSRSVDDKWFTTLGRLGWRDTPSRQNLIVKHALKADVSAALDDIDSLLRRNQAIGELTPVLLAAEGDPAWRDQMVGRLRQHPSWRFGYLQRGSLIDVPAVLQARARTIRTLQHMGDDVTAAEIAPVLPNMLAAGLGAEAFAIWRAHEPSIARPIADPNFAKLAREREPSTVPFHWQLTNGPDYSVTAASAPAPHLTMSWDGAGAPVFAAQYLSAPAGRYSVVITTLNTMSRISAMIGVRAICGAAVVDFVRNRALDVTSVIFTADRGVPCAFPRLELFGRSAGGSHDQQATISRIEIRPSI